MKLKHIFTLAIAATIALVSCKKSDPDAPSQGSRLVKMTNWQPSSGNEIVIFEDLTYNADGQVTGGKASGGQTYSVNYNANKQAINITSTYADGRKNTFDLVYNAAGLVTKNTHSAITAAGVSTVSNTHVYDYNAQGKLAKKTTTTGGGTITTANYTWVGENISEYNYTSTGGGGTVYTYKYKYDDKLNPFYGGGVAVEFGIYGSPVTKNNATEINIIYTGFNGTQKRVYTYNADGYATSMKLDDASNEGNKFYYTK